MALALPPLAFLAAFFVWPVVAILLRGLRPDGQWDLSALGDVLTDPVIRRADARTNPILIGCLILALIGVLLFIVLPVMAFMSITPEMWEEILSQVGDSI